MNWTSVETIPLCNRAAVNRLRYYLRSMLHAFQTKRITVSRCNVSVVVVGINRVSCRLKSDRLRLMPDGIMCHGMIVIQCLYAVIDDVSCSTLTLSMQTSVGSLTQTLPLLTVSCLSLYMHLHKNKPSEML